MWHSSIALFKELTNKISDKKNKPKKVILKKYAPSVFMNSLKLRVVDAWDDESTMTELYSLQWGTYSLDSYWIDFVASPKHADWIVIVWAITKNMLDPLLRTYAVVPEPKVVIALWDKAINWDPRFEWCIWRTDKYLKVDLEIPWDPPKPELILSYLHSFIKGK